MAAPVATLDSKKFIKELEKAAKEVGSTTAGVLRRVMQAWVKDLIASTQPAKKVIVGAAKSAGGDLGKKILAGITLESGKIANDRRIGMRRVEKDIKKVIFPFDGPIFDPTFQFFDGEHVDGAPASLHVFKTKRGAVYGVDKDLVMLSASNSQMAKYHDKARSKRTGRVTWGRNQSESGGKALDIGRWKFVDRLHVAERVQARYIKFRQKAVGSAKRGWMNAARRWNVKVPAWVTKAKSGEGLFDLQGGSIDTLNEATMTGNLSAWNNVDHVRDTHGMMNATLRTRYRDLKGGNLVKRWQKEIQKMNNKVKA